MWWGSSRNRTGWWRPLLFLPKFVSFSLHELRTEEEVGVAAAHQCGLQVFGGGGASEDGDRVAVAPGRDQAHGRGLAQDGRGLRGRGEEDWHYTI